MWPLPPLNHKTVHIIVKPEQASCYYINQNSNQQPYVVASQQYELSTITPNIMHNPTVLQQAINSFLSANELQHSFAHIVLCRPLIEEQLVRHHNSYAQLEDLITVDRQMDYHHSYIGPDGQQFLFYISGIARPLLLQLKMLPNHIPLHLQTVRSPLSTQYECYNKLHASNFNQTQLVQDIDKEKIMIKNIFSSQLFAHDKTTQFDENLLYAIGSFIGSNQ